MNAMRVLLDTNILISYLLNPRRESAATQIIRLGVLGKFVQLFPEELLEELARKAAQKKYLAERLTTPELEELVDILSRESEIIPKITEEIPAVSRDPKDDYLLAYALVGQADYLVTGDKDLLVLERVGTVTIVTPRQFWQIVRRL